MVTGQDDCVAARLRHPFIISPEGYSPNESCPHSHSVRFLFLFYILNFKFFSYPSSIPNTGAVTVSYLHNQKYFQTVPGEELFRPSLIQASLLTLMVSWTRINLLSGKFFEEISDFFRMDSNMCLDLSSQCPYWASTGQCASNPVVMQRTCMRSCGTCSLGSK